MLRVVAVLAALLPGAALAEDWGGVYAEVYGGVRLGGTSTFFAQGDSETYVVDGSGAFGAALGIGAPLAGLSFELDVMRTGEALFDESGCCALSSFSVMVNAEYAVPIDDTFELYGALGLGAVNIAVLQDPSAVSLGRLEQTADGWGAGYQAAVGARINVTDSIAVFGEVKHQNTFAPVSFDLDGYSYDVAAPTNSLLVGARFSF